MDKIYCAKIITNNGGWNGYKSNDLGYYKHKINAWKRIAEYMQSIINSAMYIQYLKINGVFHTSIPEDYTKDMLIVDIEQEKVPSLTINFVDYYFEVSEIKIEDN